MSRPDDERDTAARDECGACPVGALFLAARGSSPETFEHLLNAASELVAAARSVLDGVERVVEQQRAGGGDHGGARVQRIDLAE